MPAAARSTAALRLACFAMALGLLSGCSWIPWRHAGPAAAPKAARAKPCNRPQLYEAQTEHPVLGVPAGLDALNTRGAMRIPALTAPEAPRKLSDPCLDEPPRFAANVRLLPPDLTKAQRKQLAEQEKARAKAQQAEAKRKQAEDKRKRAEERAAKKAARKAAREAARREEQSTPETAAPAPAAP